MEFVASVLGLNAFLPQSKRTLARKEPTLGRRRPRLADSTMMYKNIKAAGWRETRDDDTASTVSSFDDSFDSTGSGTSCCVTFAQEIVTAVHERPITTSSEKKTLFYCDRDFRRFRHEFHHGPEPKESTVQFHPTVISSVYTFPNEMENKEALFYSEKDLQRFLDDFVQSLHATMTEGDGL